MSGGGVRDGEEGKVGRVEGLKEVAVGYDAFRGGGAVLYCQLGNLGVVARQKVSARD